MIRSKSQVNKSSDLPNGVSRFEEVDHRRPGSKPVVGFGVLVKINKMPNILKFRTTKSVTEKHAELAACACRRYYERCENKHLDFQSNIMADWQKWSLIEFSYL